MLHCHKLINPFVEIGKIKGRTEGELAVVLRLLAKKFPKLAPKVEKQVKTFDEETLLSSREALLFMQTEADCRKWLKTKR
jgi:hypothetical protein